MTTGLIERHRPRSPNDPLNQAQFAWAAAWRAACKHDGIPETARFAIFSDDNPFVQFVDAGARELFARIAEYQSGGYVGLTISPAAWAQTRRPRIDALISACRTEPSSDQLIERRRDRLEQHRETVLHESEQHADQGSDCEAAHPPHDGLCFQGVHAKTQPCQLG